MTAPPDNPMREVVAQMVERATRLRNACSRNGDDLEAAGYQRELDVLAMLERERSAAIHQCGVNHEHYEAEARMRRREEEWRRQAQSDLEDARRSFARSVQELGVSLSASEADLATANARIAELKAALEPFEKFSGTSFQDGSLCTIRVYARELRAVRAALQQEADHAE